MPIFYNSSSPTPSTKNTINSVTVGYGIRDYLLNLNLLPTSMLPAGYSTNTTINGSPKVGEPVLDTLVNNGSNGVPKYLPLEQYGIYWKDLNNINNNTFKNTSQTANDLSSIDYIPDSASFGDAEWPLGIQYPNISNDDVKKYGVYGKTLYSNFRQDNVIKNLYFDTSKQYDVADFLELQIPNIENQVKGYLDEYGALNTGSNTKALDIAGSLLSGQGIGLSKGGVTPNFDIRSSLAGRVLGAAGFLKDTKLGLIGGQQLALALANNAAFNVQQELFGALNVQDNVLGLIKGEGLGSLALRPSYKITVPEGKVSRAFDVAGKLLGFTLPKSYMTDDGSIFQSESGQVDNITRANSLLKTTGKGQLEALIKNITANINGTRQGGVDSPNYSGNTFRSGYAPGYFLDNKGKDVLSSTKLYAYWNEGKIIDLLSSSDGIIPDMNLESRRGDLSIAYGFESPDDLEFVGHAGPTDYSNRNINKVGFSWGSENSYALNGKDSGASNYSELRGDKKSLLVKTQKLFNSIGMRNIVTIKGDMGRHASQINTANGGGVSKGSAVLSKEMFGYKDPNDPTKTIMIGEWNRQKKTAEETFCRSWTTLNRYDSIDNLVRNHALYSKDDKKVPFRHGDTSNSVLEDTGFVKVAPYFNDFLNPNVPRSAKNYMLSIENLAWSDNKESLPKGEQGLGDPISGKKGRIMWFPPYDIQFSESVSVDWEPHKFIGRGENIYTYNNTERTGQLSFKIIVDHPTYMNTFRGTNGPDDNYVASFFAGCIEPDSIWTDKFNVQTISDVVTKNVKPVQEKVAPPEPKTPKELKVYFPNDNASFEGSFGSYENGKSGATDINYSVYNGTGGGIGVYNGKYTSKRSWPDTNNWGLNYSSNSQYTEEIEIDDKKIRGFFDPNYYTTLQTFLKEKCPFCDVEVIGYASDQGKDTPNEKLAKDRATYILEQLKTNVAKPMGLKDDEINSRFKANLTSSKELQSSPTVITYTFDGKEKTVNGKVSSNGCYVCPSSMSIEERKVACPVDTIGCKKDRYASIKITHNSDKALEASSPEKQESVAEEKKVKGEFKQFFYDETMFFEKLKETDRFIFDKFKEKIKYFHPAFHSMTPEGLNSRLTFLQQCTRQGPTIHHNTNNLAFGRAPICILRIGDFYNTKIVIDSLGIEYEPLVWDLNPEGIGVQPMIANVSLSFKFIGAESLEGPINKLQNALSFNYYANTRVYEARSDYYSSEKPVGVSGDTETNIFLHNGEKNIDSQFTPYKEESPSETNQQKANEQVLSSEPTPPPATESASVGILKNSKINFYYNKEDFFEIILADLSGLEDGWGCRVEINSGTQLVPLSVQTIDPVKDINDKGRVIIKTKSKRGDLDLAFKNYDTNVELKKIYLDEGSPANLACYSADTNTLKIETLTVFVTYFKNGEENIRKSEFKFVMSCKDDEVKSGDFKYFLEEAQTNKINCLMC